jgi:phosphoribosylformylglycinamidine synthase
LLPGIGGDYRARSVALTYNDCGKFRNDWVNLKVNSLSPCIFTKGLEHIALPIRHGEGKFYADEPVLRHLTDHHQVAVQYALPDNTPADGRFPFNPNGSLYDIAGICDPTGRVFGLMPHPEAFNHYTNHPNWTRDKEVLKRQKKTTSQVQTPGIRIFQNAVAYMR